MWRGQFKREIPVESEQAKDGSGLITRAADAGELTELEQFEVSIGDSRRALRTLTSNMRKALMLADMVKMSQAVVRKHMPTFMALQNNAVGFMTDKCYTQSELEGPLTECLVRGLAPVMNQVNIIGGRLYIAVAGCEALFDNNSDWISPPKVHLGSVQIVKEPDEIMLPKEKWVEKSFGNKTWIQKTRKLKGQARVEATAECIVRSDVGATRTVTVEFLDFSSLGDKKGIDERIVIGVNEGMGEDAILGKARRRVLSRLFAAATGDRSWDWGDDDPDATIDAAPSSVTVLDGAAKPSASGDPFGPAPGSVEEFAERATQCENMKELSGLWAEYTFSEADMEQAKAIGAENKARIRANQA
jgi:hypothetical protein